MTAIDYHNIITIEQGKRSGKPCIRGLRITVDDILDCFASGMSEQEILEDYDYLTQDDIIARLSCVNELPCVMKYAIVP